MVRKPHKAEDKVQDYTTLAKPKSSGERLIKGSVYLAPRRLFNDDVTRPTSDTYLPEIYNSHISRLNSRNAPRNSLRSETRATT